MSEIRKGLLYTEDHEWVKVDGNKAYVGISDYAQAQLGEVVYVELPEVDEEFEKDDEISSIESVKAASAIINPLSGTVVEVNEALEDAPESINSDCYEAYIYAIELSDESQLDGLLDDGAYAEFLETL